MILNHHISQWFGNKLNLSSRSRYLNSYYNYSQEVSTMNHFFTIEDNIVNQKYNHTLEASHEVQSLNPYLNCERRAELNELLPSNHNTQSFDWEGVTVEVIKFKLAVGMHKLKLRIILLEGNVMSISYHFKNNLSLEEKLEVIHNVVLAKYVNLEDVVDEQTAMDFLNKRLCIRDDQQGLITIGNQLKFEVLMVKNADYYASILKELRLNKALKAERSRKKSFKEMKSLI